MNRPFARVGMAASVALLTMLLTLSSKASALQLLWTREATIADIQAAVRSKEISCRQLVQMYLDRIEAYRASTRQARRSIRSSW